MSLGLMMISSMSHAKRQIFQTRSRHEVSHMSLCSRVRDYIVFSPYFPIHAGNRSLIPTPTFTCHLPPTPFLPGYSQRDSPPSQMTKCDVPSGPTPVRKEDMI